MTPLWFWEETMQTKYLALHLLIVERLPKGGGFVSPEVAKLILDVGIQK